MKLDIEKKMKIMSKIVRHVFKEPQSEEINVVQNFTSLITHFWKFIILGFVTAIGGK